MARLLGLLSIVLFSSISARTVDTTIVADGRKGPYRLGNHFIDSTALRVTVLDSTVALPPYRFVADSGAIVFEQPPDSGVVLRVTYEVDYLGLSRTVRLYPVVALTDTGTGDSSADASAGLASRRLEQSITVDGYKTIGVSLGAHGNAAIEQTLDVTITGKLGRRTEVRGHVSDQGTTLDGGTRELSEVDRIYLTLEHPRYQATVGDQYVKWLAGGLITQNKKIKGISAGLTTRPFRIRAFGAISGGKYAVQTIIGEDGIQGPYPLHGNGEADIITPISGTMRVSVDGEELREGYDGDYTVDYDYGSITFAPHVLITAENVIRAEYEYKTFDYRRTLVGGDVGVTTRDSVFTVSGALWNEADNERDPIDLSLSQGDIELLQESGDSSLASLIRIPIDKRDIDTWAALYPLYTLRDSVFEYYAYVPGGPPPDVDLYYVPFRDVAPGRGDYVVDTVDYRGEIYRYVGPGFGDVTAVNDIPLPQRTTTGELQARLRLPSWFDLRTDIAGVSHDRNLFSPHDDEDNNGAATRVVLQLGRRDGNRKGAWLHGQHRLFTRDYSQTTISAYESTELWHLDESLRTRAMRQVWDATGGFSLGTPLLVELGYGQVRHDDLLLAGRVTASARTALGRVLSLAYQGRYISHPTDSLDRSRREDVGATLSFEKTRWSLSVFDEWRRNDTVGVGQAGAKASFLLHRPQLSEEVTYAVHGPGTGPLVTLRDTLYTLVWSQGLAVSPLPFWHVRLQSRWHTRWRTDGEGNASTILVDASNELAVPRSGLITNVDYRLSSEKASALVQIPNYAGTGLGTHAYDSTRGELVPDENGSFLLMEREVQDHSTTSTVRKSALHATWSFKPRRRIAGILGDLRWRGELGSIEHVVPDSTTTSLSWLPGYLTVSETDTAAVRLAHCFYEQRISWEPDRFEGYHAELRIRPYVKVPHSGREEGIEGSFQIDREHDPWFIGAELEGRRFVHGGANEFDVTDIGLELTQKRLLGGHLYVSVRETGGWARKEDSDGWYGILTPGLSWEPPGRGWARGSYSFAYVKIPGRLDHAMAQGFDGGMTHRIELLADVRLGEHFSLGGRYRGEFVKPLHADSYKEPLHVLSLEVKAYL